MDARLLLGMACMWVGVSNASTCQEDSLLISSVTQLLSSFANSGSPSTSSENMAGVHDFFMIDTTGPTLSHLNADGVVTPGPFGSAQLHASGLLISRCHVLVNRHTVKRFAYKKKGLEDSVGDKPELFEKGLELYFSAGQLGNCGAGFIVSSRGVTIEVGKLNDSIGDDYAIVRLDRPIMTISPAPLATRSLPNGYVARSGFPAVELLKNDVKFQRLRMQRTSIVSGDYLTGVIVVKDDEKYGGMSGGSIRQVFKDKISEIVYGIHVMGNLALSTKTIWDRLSDVTKADIAKAQTSDTCLP